MSSVEQLCSYCREIPLDPDILEVRNWAGIRFSLGPWSRVRKSRCPLCRLLQLFSYENYRVADGKRLDDADELRIVWSDTRGPGGRGSFYVEGKGDHCLCFVAQPDSPRTTENAFYFQPIVRPQLDFSRVKDWLSTCETQHDGRCYWNSNMDFSSAFPGLQVLRFIDVIQENLVEVRELKRYVALSYVWGNVTNFRLTNANKEQLMIPGSIKKHFDKLPTTIQDAVVLVRKLGLRYLWVDSLCLIQNESCDLDRGVQVMDLVYEQSWVTVIAACGHNANAGLPGIHPYTRKKSKMAVEVKPGLSLGVYASLDHLLRPTVYNSRAWTFQEHVLCRRALYFVDNKVFFRCAYAEYSESCIDHAVARRPRPLVGSLLTEAVHLDDPLADYSIMILYFSQKALTNQHDVLRAMTGIMRRVSDKIGSRFLEGFPAAALDAFIKFKKYGYNNHRRTGFPSYSWAGWRGGISINPPFDWEMNDWLMSQTWIVWYKRNPSGLVNLIWDPEAFDSKPLIGKSYVAPTTNGYFKLRAPANIKTTRTAPTEQWKFEKQIPSYPLLQFWTMCGFYKLSDIDVFDGTCRVKGRDGAACGTMSLDGFEESTFFDSQGPLQVIFLSGIDQANVMLIEWNGGIAERRGIGTLSVHAMEASFFPGPKWTEIVLG